MDTTFGVDTFFADLGVAGFGLFRTSGDVAFFAEVALTAIKETRCFLDFLFKPQKRGHLPVTYCNDFHMRHVLNERAYEQETYQPPASV